MCRTLRTTVYRSDRSASFGRCSVTSSPGVFVLSVLNSPRIPAGASGFGSNVSRWLGPPNWKSMMTLLAVAFSSRRPSRPGVWSGAKARSVPPRPTRSSDRRVSMSGAAKVGTGLGQQAQSASRRWERGGRRVGGPSQLCPTRYTGKQASSNARCQAPQNRRQSGLRRHQPFVSPTGPSMSFRLATTALLIAASASSVGAAEPVSFAREVVPILTKAGCNAGACHGTPTGKNGFRLSLRGYDPALDIHTLTREMGGRRIDRIAPDRSLILQKATARIAHEGGRRLDPDGDLYRLLRDWIAQGAPTIATDPRGRSPSPSRRRKRSSTRRPTSLTLKVVADVPGRRRSGCHAPDAVHGERRTRRPRRAGRHGHPAEGRARSSSSPSTWG